MKTFCYDPGCTYSLAEFEEVNSSTRAHEVMIDDTPISHFELDSKKHLIPMPQTPIEKEAAVMEIARQLANWNIQSRQNGVCTLSQGGFNFNGAILAPDVAFTPKEVYRALDEKQRRTFQGDPFSPTFAVEVEDLIATGKLSDLTHKFKDMYFPASLELGWLIDPINKEVFVFKRDKDGTVRRHKHAWYDTDGIATVLDGRDILPGFELELWQIDEALSQDSSESEPSDDEDIACPKCDKSFDNIHHLMEHFEEEHARRKRKVA